MPAALFNSLTPYLEGTEYLLSAVLEHKFPSSFSPSI